MSLIDMANQPTNYNPVNDIPRLGSVPLIDVQVNPVTTVVPEPDVINSPSHYARGRFEVWDIIEHFRLNYNIGNVAKYILRAGVKTKSPVQDYKKAIVYLQREVDILEGRLDVRPQ